MGRRRKLEFLISRLARLPQLIRKAQGRALRDRCWLEVERFRYHADGGEKRKDQKTAGNEGAATQHEPR